MASRHLNASVIIPLVLAFCIGVLVYLYGTSKSQYSNITLELKELQKDIANVRNEKENLQYELNTKRDELERVSKEKNEVVEREASLEEKAMQMKGEIEKARNDLLAELKKTKDELAEIQDDKDRAKSDVNTYINKWKQCEDGKKEVNKQAKLRDTERNKQLDNLRQESELLRSAKTDVERRLNEIEQSYIVCQSQLKSHGSHEANGVAPNAIPQQEAVVVDDRSMELLPPAAAPVAKQHHPSNDIRHEGVGQPHPPVHNAHVPDNNLVQHAPHQQ